VIKNFFKVKKKNDLVLTTFSGPIHGFFHQIYIINYVPPPTKPICMGLTLVSRKVCCSIDKTFVMGHQLPILEWFLDLKMSMIIVRYNSLGTFPISLMVYILLLTCSKMLFWKTLLECHQSLVLYPLGGTWSLFELPPKKCLCIWTHSYLMWFWWAH